jgi:hypothetical protein
LSNSIKNPKTQRKETMLTVLLILVLAVSSLIGLGTVSTAKAHSPPQTFPTYAYVSAAPYTVGVGQQITVVMWLDRFPPTAGGGGGDRFKGFVLNIVKPDGTNDTMGPYTSDPIASYALLYTPQTVGTYTFQWSWPGQVLQAGVNPNPAGLPYVNDTFSGAMSRAVKVTVQNQQIAYITPQNPLPTAFWTRPINIENQAWTSIAGNWLMAAYNSSSRFNPFSQAPNSAHIVWVRNYDTKSGGLVGGELGTGIGYYGGATYEMPFTPPLIMNGILYYNGYPNVGSGGVINSGFYAVDIRTGQELWFNNGTGNGQSVTTILQGFGNNVNTFNPGYPALTIAQPYDFQSPNQNGAQGYLWSIGGVNNATGTTIGTGTIGQSGSGNSIRYDMYNAQDGKWIMSFNNALTGTNVFGPNNELLVYVINYPAGWLAMWNSSLAIPLPALQGTDQYQWRPPTGSTINWLNGVQWNVTIDKTQFPSTVGVTPAPALAISKTDGNTLVCSMLIALNTGQYNFVHAGFSAANGKLNWVQQHSVPSDKAAIQIIGSGIYVMWVPEQLAWYGFSATTGTQLWGPTTIQTNDWAYYGLQPQYAYGMFYGSGYDGTMEAWNITTGALVWSTYEGANNEVPYGQIPLNGGGGQNSLAIADGKVYAENGEHSPDQPLYYGEKLWCFDAFTGKILWNMTGWDANDAIADGYLVTINAYNNQIDCFGVGQSATTISAPQVTMPQGTPVMITGTVTDQSPGQTALGIPAKGTPAISDDNMSAWMDYLYMQHPQPTNVKGVPVTLTYTDPNGNSGTIPTTTSDVTGSYAISWTPPVQGLYTITATFTGSKSYYSSTAEAHLIVGPATISTTSSASPAPSTTTTTSTPSTTSSPSAAPLPGVQPSTVLYIGIALVVVIIVVVAAALVLRKRK